MGHLLQQPSGKARQPNQAEIGDCDFSTDGGKVSIAAVAERRFRSACDARRNQAFNKASRLTASDTLIEDVIKPRNRSSRVANGTRQPPCRNNCERWSASNHGRVTMQRDYFTWAKQNILYRAGC